MRWLGVFGAVFAVLFVVGCVREPGSTSRFASPIERTRVGEQAPVQVLEFKVAYVLDEQGAWQEQLVQRYRVLTQAGVEEWGSTGKSWSPWYMQRPELAASIVGPDGKTQALDPKTIAVSPVYPDAPDVYSDRRILRAPLPGVRVGSIIEERISTRTKRPFFAGGSAIETVFQTSVPRDRVELSIDVPRKLSLNYEILDARVQVEDREQAERRRLVFRGGPYSAVEPLDVYAPPELPALPAVIFSVAGSWNQVATAYADALAPKLGRTELGPILRGAVRDGDTPKQKIEKLTAAVRGRVRYTSIAFGDSAIIPAASAQTLERGYGDCKDQAILLVDLLRAAGIDARVALLRAGPGEDVRERVPALNVFDHAIVFVPGEPALWIDPTDPYARPGELLEQDQNRLALVADGKTTGLVRTPIATIEQNAYLEVRELRLQKFGRATVVETTTAHGNLEQRVRSSFSESRDTVSKSLTDYIKETYTSDKLARLEYTDPFELGQPLRVTIETGPAQAAITNMMDASAALNDQVLFGFLPKALFLEEEPPRRMDFVLPFAQRIELRYQIRTPEGFVAKPLPPQRTFRLGPASLSRSFRASESGGVEARLVLDIPKARLTPEELGAFRSGVQELDRNPLPLVEFEHIGQRLIEGQKSRQGLDVFRKTVAAHPNDAIDRLRLALTLVDLGFGRAAREEARRALALAPTNAVVQRSLGVILSRDEFGRPYRSGFDRDGALAAYARAAELDADETYSRLERAVVFEHDAAGHRYRDRGGLERAIEQYDSVKPDELEGYSDGEYAANPLVALLWAERFEELIRRLEKLPVAKVPAGVAIASVAALRGSLAGLSEADRLGLRGEQRSKMLATAGETLFALRRYPEAAALIAAAGQGSSDSVRYTNRAQFLSRVKRTDPARLPAKTPVEVGIKALVLASSSDKPDDKLLEPLVVARAFGQGSRLLAFLNGFGAAFGAVQVPRAVAADSTFATLSGTASGDDQRGHRVELLMAAPGVNGRRVKLYVARERGSYRIRAFESAITELGCEAFAAARAGNAARARRWLEWAREEMHESGGNDALAMDPFVRIWNDGKGDLLESAAALCARNEDDTGKDALNALSEARNKRPDAAGSDTEARDHALAIALLAAKQDARALEHATRLHRAHPKSKKALELELEALWELNRQEAYEKLVQQALAEPGQEEAQRVELQEALARSQTKRGQIARARDTLRALVKSGRARASTYNNLAWMALFLPGATDQDLEYALQAVQLTNFGAAGPMHTLAALYAERGKLDEARQTLGKLLELRTGGAPEPIDWYIVGRLAEEHSLPDIARQAYAAVVRDEWPISTYQLAQRRLAAMPSGAASRPAAAR